MSVPYYDHGAEIFISLILLLFSNSIFIIDKPVLLHYTSVKRFGSAIRPSSNYTRIEPLCAQFEFINIYKMLMIRRNMPIFRIRFNLFTKCFYTIFFYRSNFVHPFSIAFCLAWDMLLQLIFDLFHNISLVVTKVFASLFSAKSRLFH